ncbi:glycoside hydrolase family 15 protein [Conexibacter sp. JD483]|uniref:glycoside hydrolase family 15 protein n=1 Tax=unclassified Conexibacter TaxID=2627773 RepID=UPI002722E584|nr:MULTISPECIES: glycoside hydrolase family 15 protein [unclassified Conexibacter]MDO8188510.1 glycoside hydrolase family 15 protein [Conexibacter sp. CPCC 205706]MDO8200146.1 glycoside hydrolase family 15 protein [Conexibacter sp. CPCC 205762]MDR9371185.1 glycoside hydrolase family 15 protein [Conexibacter sp. JD483]
MSTPPISGYALIGDCQTAALVGRDGSVDWWPGPRFDGPSVFSRLLDRDAGHFWLRPTAPYTVTRRYLPRTMVLETTFATAAGKLVVSDCLAFAAGARGHEIGLEVPHALVRVVAARGGAVELEGELRPRLEYGLAAPSFLAERDGLSTIGGAERLRLDGDLPFTPRGTVATARLTLADGERRGVALRRAPGMSLPPGVLDPHAALSETIAGWRSWAEQHDHRSGPFGELVQRSALILQALTYQPTGALVAAATTSLPERIGGEANWDYRYGWLRDASLTARALLEAACADEAERWFAWTIAAARTCAEADHVQIVFGVGGERALHEQTLDHLRGYRDSSPVRIGNDAWRQLQLDVFGELLGIAAHLHERLDGFTLDAPTAGFLAQLADRAARDWELPDAGMWESRDEPRHHTISKLLCWVALDRAVVLAPLLEAALADGDPTRPGEPRPQPRERVATWAREAERIRAALLERAWNERLGAFAGTLDGDGLDVAVLLIGLSGLLEQDDPRLASTATVLERELGAGGLLRRWSGAEDGAFLPATCWLAQWRAETGDPAAARELLQRVLAHANDVGLLSEEADPASGESLGNVPQALTHAGVINAAAAIEHAERD